MPPPCRKGFAEEEAIETPLRWLNVDARFCRKGFAEEEAIETNANGRGVQGDAESERIR